MKYSESLKKSIYSFISFFLNNNELEFKVWEESESPLLVIVLDVAKIDKNSGSYDEKYHNKIFGGYFKAHKVSKFVWNFLGKYDDLLKAIKNYFDIDFRMDYEFINYGYLDDIEKDINEKLKQTEYSNVIAEFTNESQKPFIYLRFRSVEKHLLDDFYKTLDEILPELIIKNNYTVSVSLLR